MARRLGLLLGLTLGIGAIFPGGGLFAQSADPAPVTDPPLICTDVPEELEELIGQALDLLITSDSAIARYEEIATDLETKISEGGDSAQYYAMLEQLYDLLDKMTAERDEMAAALAPYCHAPDAENTPPQE